MGMGERRTMFRRVSLGLATLISSAITFSIVSHFDRERAQAALAGVMWPKETTARAR